MCDGCGCVLHSHQAEPSAMVTIDRTSYRVCGECRVRLEAMLNRGAPPEIIRFDRRRAAAVREN